MKQNIIAAALLGICLIVAAFVHTGRYYALAIGDGEAIKVDRWTGKTWNCFTSEEFGSFVCIVAR